MNPSDADASRSTSGFEVKRDSAPDQRWRLTIAGVPLTIERLDAGRWCVLYGGFSRASDQWLVEAIAVAAGAQTHELWIAELARRIEDEASSR